MPAVLQLHLSGGAANTAANASLGGARSTAAGGVVPTNSTANSIFDDVGGAQEQAGDVNYRCLYLYNSGDAEATLGKFWLSANTPDPDTSIAVGLGSSAVGATEQTITNETTAPTGVTFSEPATEGDGLTVPTLAAGAHKAIWLRRTVNVGGGASADTFTVNCTFDTGP